MSNLILQAPTLERTQVDALATLFDGAAVEAIGPGAFRLKGVPVREAVASWCEERHIDHAWMPEGRRFAGLKLLTMDMDSTLITVECIDELGDLAGKRAEIASITARAMRGELDYPASLRRRVALLAGLQESALERVYEERVKLTPGAQELISECKKQGVKLLLVSGGFTFFVERLKERLGIDYTISNVLEIQNGRLTGEVLGDIVDAEAKAAKFRQVAAELKAEKHQTVAIGDGANDLKMMAEAGVSVAFRAKPVVRAQASCALNWSGLDAVVRLFE
jgi:phosphoserine phosphatase